MATYEITAPDGTKYRVTGAGTREEALAQIQAQHARTKTQDPQTQAAIRSGELPPLQGEPRIVPQTTAAPAPKTFAEKAKADLSHAGRQTALLARSGVEGVVDTVAPFADLLGFGLNKVSENLPVPLPKFPENHSAAASADLTRLGVPAPSTPQERAANFWGRFATGMYAGGVLAKPFTAATPAAQPQYASSRAARTLEQAGVRLDRSQRMGGEFMNRMRSALHDNPLTTSAQARFSKAQLQDYTRAVLRTIGASSDEASQEVMDAAAKRIGSVFDDVGKAGAQFDDVLEQSLVEIVDSARATTTASDLAPLLKNVDDILKAAADDASGRIGPQLVRIRSNLSALSKNPGVGQWAREVEDALLSAMERSSAPGQRAILRDAVDQYRNMRIIEAAISKGDERLLSPRLLSNAVSSMRNRAMSIYGRGGDQWLVDLARAGRDVLPETMGQSGTTPRGMMQAQGLIRSTLSYPFYKGAQLYMQAQPAAPGSGVLLRETAPLVPGAIAVEAQRRRNALDYAE